MIQLRKADMAVSVLAFSLKPLKKAPNSICANSTGGELALGDLPKTFDKHVNRSVGRLRW